MIAVDTNILVHAHRADSRFHQAAFDAVKALAEGDRAWAIPWPCVDEFLAVVTNARVFAPPTPMKAAARQVTHWLASPSLSLIGETAEHWDRLGAILKTGRVAGGHVHDARIAAICIENGIEELWTADRDFGGFGIQVRNPLSSRES